MKVLRFLYVVVTDLIALPVTGTAVLIMGVVYAIESMIRKNGALKLYIKGYKAGLELAMEMNKNFIKNGCYLDGYQKEEGI